MKSAIGVRRPTANRRWAGYVAHSCSWLSRCCTQFVVVFIVPVIFLKSVSDRNFTFIGDIIQLRLTHSPVQIRIEPAGTMSIQIQNENSELWLVL